MKKVIAIIIILSAVRNLTAQMKEGKILYEQKVDMYRRIPESDQQTRAMLPPVRTAKFELLFADNQSLYKAAEEEPDLTEQNTHGGIVVKIGGGADNEYYKNFTTRQATDKRELMDEIYLVEDSIRSITWKLEESETKIIAGHSCKKATGKTERGTDIIAWYTTDIVIFSGPEQFNGLPGMILGLDANKGEFIFTAISIDKKVDRKNLKAPVKGKKMTGPAFAKLQKDMMGNQGGPVRITRH